MRSSHHCLGGWDPVPPTESADLGTVDAPWGQISRNQHERGCVFRNVCFRAGGEWNYYAPLGEFEEVETLRAGVDVWSRGGFGRNLPPKDQPFRVTHSALPAEVGWLRSPTLVHVSLFAPSNFGHFLGNGLFPAFHAVWRLLGAAAATDPSMQLLFAGPNQTDPAHVQRVRRRCMRAKAGGVGGTPAAGRGCVDERIPERISKFVEGLVPGLSDAPPLWDESLARLAARERGGLICARRLLVGVGGLSFATVYEHDDAAGAGTAQGEAVRRRPPLPLWSDFIEHMSRRLLRGNGAEDAESARTAVLIIKEGRRAPTGRAFERIRAAVAQLLPIRLRVVDPSGLSIREQLRIVSRAPLGIAPDGGTSLLGAFLPDGASLIVLGSLERWVWANDRRVRAFYCTPSERERHAHCDAGGSSDCYEAEAVLPCIKRRMLPRARAHAALTWPALLNSAANSTRGGQGQRRA